MLIKFVRLIFLVTSFYGFLQMVSKKMQPELAISYIFSAIGSVMFLAGILNILQEMSYLICLSGCFFAWFSIKNRDSVKLVLTPGILIFLCSCLILLFVLYDKTFVHYDNYSHWGISTKVILEENRFPNFQTSNIYFQSYPLGHASVIYYFSKILGISTEWFQLFIQAVLICGLLTSIFAFCKGSAQIVFGIIACVFISTGNTGFVDLLVDTLLPVTAIAAFSMCVYCNLKNCSIFPMIIPHCVFLVSIKNSGILFVVLVLCAWLFYFKKFKDLRGISAVAVISVVTLILWQKHVDLVFTNGMMSYHSMSVNYFNKILDTKNINDINIICSTFFSRVFSLNNGVLYLFVSIISISLIQRKNIIRKLCVDSILYVAFSYAVYQISLLGMYLFTMPLNEAIRLASYSRYHDTILIYLVGVHLLMYLSTDMCLSDPFVTYTLRHNISSMLICLICAFFVVNPSFSIYSKYDYNKEIRSEIRCEIETLIDEFNVLPQKQYMFLADESFDQVSFTRWVVRYLLDPKSVQIELVNKDINKDIDVNAYDYVIALDMSENVVTFMEELVPYNESRVIKMH